MPSLRTLLAKELYRANSESLQSTSLCVALTAKMGVKQKNTYLSKEACQELSCKEQRNATNGFAGARGRENDVMCE